MRVPPIVILVTMCVAGAPAAARVPPSDADRPPGPPPAVDRPAVEPGGARADDPADDPLYPEQWALENTGQGGGAVDADIDAEAAWELTEGDEEVLVGVLDTGVDITHPDLADVLWVNDAELAGVDGVDDDANGCIDDIHGCWFSEGCTDDDPSCAPQPVGARFDFGSHGTQVAGIIAAAAHNREGGRGVAPRVRIVVLHVATPGGLFWDEPVYRALAYAASLGVDIINISAYFDGPDLAYQDQALGLATAAGALVIASAGNWGVNRDEHLDDLPYMPDLSNNPAILRVAAVDRYERFISYAGSWGSDYSPSTVHVAAPSTAIITPRPTTDGRGDYSYGFNGTSAAAPFATGVAALALSANPSLTALELKAVVESSVDPLPELADKIASGGRVNAANAVRAALGMGTPPGAAVEAPDRAEVGEPVALRATGTDLEGGALAYRWSFGDGATGEGDAVSHVYASGGFYDVTLEVIDEAGMRATARHRVEVGFEWVESASVIESGHPYEPGYYVFPLELPSTRWARLHFARLELPGVDNDFVGDDDAVQIFDASGTPVWTRSGLGEDLWTAPLPVTEAGLRLVLAGQLGGGYGFRVDRVAITGDPGAFDGADSGCGCRSSGDSGGPWLGGLMSGGLVLLALAPRRRRSRGEARR